MFHTRRKVIQSAAVAGIGVSLVGSRSGNALSYRPLFENGYPDRKSIINAAVDAAMKAGATYADARLCHYERISPDGSEVNRAENMTFGVRALYKGYWGFASSPIWGTNEAVRLGQSAVFQAQSTVLGRERITDLAPISSIESGHWETPIIDNPFETHYDEMNDYLGGLRRYVMSLEKVATTFINFSFERYNKAFGSSENQYTTQTIYNASGMFGFGLRDPVTRRTAGATVEEVSYASAGIEYMRNSNIRNQAKLAHEEALEDLKLPVEPVDVGRFNVLIDQYSLANITNRTVGAATELDRALGFEANAGGTSYINEPESMIGSLKIGAPILNVACDNTRIGSVGNYRWDDEGVQPKHYDLIKDGILVDMQTNREAAGWLNRNNIHKGKAMESRGTALANQGTDSQLIRKADLVLKSGEENLSQDDLRSELKNGIEIRIARSDVDFQQTSGLTKGAMYTIRNGKRVAVLQNSGMLFRTSELWANVIKLGGSSASKYYGISSNKGQPMQQAVAGVYTPPALLKEMTFIDTTRKA